MPAPRKYPDELRQRAVKLYQESDAKPVDRPSGPVTNGAVDGLADRWW